MFTRFVVKVFKRKGDQDDWETTSTDLTNYYDVQVSQSLGENKDAFSFKIDNVRGSRSRSVELLDQVHIHYCINGAVASDANLIMVGLIKKISLQSTNKQLGLRVEGVSFSDVMTQALVFYNPGTATQNVMQWFQSCLASVRDRNPNFQVGWNSGNPVLKSDESTPFPTFTEDTNRIRAYDKSMGKLLELYLKDEYTKDGSYFWYVNSAKELVIRKSFTTGTTLALSQGVDFENFKVGINGDDVKNYVIVKCGYDLNNNPISAVYDDVVSRAKHGFRYHIDVAVFIAKDIKDANPGISNADLIAEAKVVGRAKARAFVKLHNNGYLVVDGQLKPRLDVFVGDNVSLSISKYPDFNVSSGSISGKVMRVQSIQYDSNGLLVSLKEEASL